MRPVGQAPLAVQVVHGDVLGPQLVNEALEHSGVVEGEQARLVVHLEADHGGVVAVALDDLAQYPLGVELEGRVGVVDFLAVAPVDGLTRLEIGGDLGVAAYQPRRNGIRGGAEDDIDSAGMGAVEHRLEPVEVELAIARLPRGPDRFADANHAEVGGGHEVEIALKIGGGRIETGPVVLVVVGGTEPHAVGENRVRRGLRHGCLLLVVGLLVVSRMMSSVGKSSWWLLGSGSVSAPTSMVTALVAIAARS